MEEDKRGHNDAANNRADIMNGAPEPSSGHAQPVPNDGTSQMAGEIEALKTENTELKDKILRLMAEMENQRRRTERDKSEFAKYAISEFARDVIGVGDNIRRAIEAVPKDAINGDPALGSLIEGVEVTERELLKVLEKYQVKRFDPLGEPFNPHLHDAMTKIDVPNVPADTVVQVIHAGYMIDERVLRPAAVIVAKGSQNAEKPKPAPAQDADDLPMIPGVMKMPEEFDAEPAAQEPPSRHHRADMQQNVLGRDFQSGRRRQSPQGAHDDRVAQFRRPRSAAGDQSFNELRPQPSGNGGVRSSALHKPVIGNGGND